MSKTWNPIKTIPKGQPVNVLTATGISCRAVVKRGEKPVKYARPFRGSGKTHRIHAKRLNASDRMIGDVRVVAWR